METEGPRLGRLMLGALLFFVLAGGAWYIAYLRAQNESLQMQRSESAQAAAESAPTPSRAAARALPVDVRKTSTLSPAERATLLQKLQADTSLDRQVWFATVSTNPHSAKLQQTLQGIFEEAGWRVRGNVSVPFTMKPGIFFFMADETPPPYVLTALDAIDSAGMLVIAGRGYRSFYDKKKAENPNWQGFALAPDQPYIVV